MKLKDKSVVVTGAGSGIGRALSIEFARHGANVTCVGRRRERLDETVALIHREGAVGLVAPTDITRRDDVLKTVELVVSRFGSIDVLFNNAGSFDAIGGVHEVDPEAWWRDVTMNLL